MSPGRPLLGLARTVRFGAIKHGGLGGVRCPVQRHDNIDRAANSRLRRVLIGETFINELGRQRTCQRELDTRSAAEEHIFRELARQFKAVFPDFRRALIRESKRLYVSAKIHGDFFVGRIESRGQNHRATDADLIRTRALEVQADAGFRHRPGHHDRRR